MLEGMNQINSVEMSQYLPMPGLSGVWVDSSTIACLLPLWEESQSMVAMVQRWHQLRPVDSTSLEPISQESAFATVRDILSTMVGFGFVLVER